MTRRSILFVTVQKITISVKAISSHRWLLLWLALALLALPLTAAAQGGTSPRPAPVILTDSQDKYPLGLHLELLADPTGQLTITDVSSPAYDDQFIPSQAAIPNPGSSIVGAIWARVQVRNQAGPATVWRLAVPDARLEYVDFYLPTDDGTGWRHQQAGRFRPVTVREVPYRYGVFKLSLPPHQPQTVYLRFQSNTPAQLPLTVWSLEAFSRHAQNELLMFGLFYGVLLVMMGYNLFLFVSLRDRSYLYLALVIAMLGLNDAFREGIAQQYLWPAWPNLYGIEISAILTGIFGLMFCASFLQTKILTPRLHKIMMVVMAGFMLNFFYHLLTRDGVPIHIILANLTIFLLVAAGYLTWRQGYRPARYFLLGWLVLLGSFFFHFLTSAGLLPVLPFDQQSMWIGTALMVLLLSLALADRINLLQTETAEANEALAEEIQERKSAQLAQSESEKKYRAVVEQATQGILVMQDGRRKYYNPAFLEMTGYSAEEYDPIPFLSLVYGDDLETVKAAYQKLVMGQDFEAIPDFRITTKSAHIKWLSVRGTRIEWEGKPAGMVFIKDITERKEAEEALQERNERYRLALQPGQIIVWQMDVATDQWELDGAVEQIIGYTAAELRTGAALTEVTHPEDLVRIGETWQPMLEGRRERYEIVHRMFHKDGSVRWVEAQGTALRDEHGQVIRILGTTRDITATRQAEELVAERTAELVEANQNLQHEIAERRKVEAALLAVQGQLELRVTERTADLKEANRQLAALLDALEERVADRTRELTTFLDLTMLVAEARTLPDILATALGRIIEASQSQAVCLHLLGQGDESCLELVAQRGLSAEQQQQLQCLPLEGPLADWLARHQEPVLDLNLTAVPLPASLRLEGFQGYLGAQLRLREQLQGVLSYFRQTSPHFSLEEISLLAALADQLAIVIENHRLRGHIEEIAVVAERQRLARDLHDSITQSLYSLNLFAHAGREAAEDGDVERLDDSLARVEGITLSVLKEMRLLLHQLQPLDLTEQSLAEALHVRFDAVERRLGIEVDYRVEGQQELPDQAAEALYRAALETLNNSLKHAEASRVTVRLEMAAPTVTLKIIDNGRGFDPEQVSGGMGLRNIQERLEQVDGCVKISSAPGAGAAVELAVTVADGPGNG